MPRLVIRKGEGVGQDRALSGVCVVGRHTDAQFVLADQLVSRTHFRVVTQTGAWYLEDLGSTNGTLVNGRRVKRQRLVDGDRIVAGGTELEFVQKDMFGPARRAAAPSPAPPAPVAPASSPSKKRR